jgi:hypothetical protein
MIVDYAYPTMMAEVALRELHKSMLMKDYAKAKEHALECLAEVRLAYQSIVVMEEKDGKASVSA